MNSFANFEYKPRKIDIVPVKKPTSRVNGDQSTGRRRSKKKRTQSEVALLPPRVRSNATGNVLIGSCCRNREHSRSDECGVHHQELRGSSISPWTGMFPRNSKLIHLRIFISKSDERFVPSGISSVFSEFEEEFQVAQ